MKFPMICKLGAVGTALLLALAPSSGHAVSPQDFTAGTTGQFVDLCSAPADSPMATAALDFCYGFAQGAVVVQLAHDAASRGGTRLFCLPTPLPSRSQTMAEFVQWAHRSPAHMGDPAADGLFRFLGERFPCPKSR